MTRWIPVRASRLHERQLVCGDTTLRQASLFPFFDQSGAVQEVLIVDADFPLLRTFRSDETRVSIPLWGPIRVDGQVRWLGEDSIDQMASLWHYDPWWLLRDSRFEDQPEISDLQLTNCAESFRREPSDFLFSRGLTSVARIVFRSLAQQYETQPFHDEMLPVRELSPSPARDTENSGWQLEPIWQ